MVVGATLRRRRSATGSKAPRGAAGRRSETPLLLRFIDQRFGFSVQILRLFDDRSCSIEKVDQRLGRGQGFLNLFKLCVAKAGNVADEFNEPVFQHFQTRCYPVTNYETNSFACSAA